MSPPGPKPPLPWGRLDEETERAWTAFQTYLRATKPRHLRSVGEAVGEKYRAVKRYSSMFRWVDRAAAWDAEQGRVESRAILSEREKIAREHIRAASIMRRVGAAELSRRAAMIERRHRLNPSSDEPYLSDRDAITMLKTGIELERELVAEAEAREPTGATEATSVDLSRLTPEEAEQLKTLLEKAGAIA